MNKKVFLKRIWGLALCAAFLVATVNPAFADDPSPDTSQQPIEVVVTAEGQVKSPTFKDPSIYSPDSVSKSNGSVVATLTVYLSGLDYGSYEDVRGRDTAGATGTSASNVDYLEAGGALLRGGYGGDQVAEPDTGNVPNTLFVDTGYTDYYRGYNQLWIMTGHSYWKIWVAYWWEDSVWTDASHQF